MDEESRYEAVRSRDARFDGEFFFAVVTTGIYCLPSCPAVTPKRRNVRFFATAAAAQGSGFRACRRCLPDAVPGSAEWNARADVVGRAVRLIGDGVVDREGVAGLAVRLGYSARQVQRQLTAELGAGPVALARAQRAHTARVLVQTTDLPITDVAFAAGFASVRQFNDTIRAVYASTPSELRTAKAPHVARATAAPLRRHPAATRLPRSLPVRRRLRPARPRGRPRCGGDHRQPRPPYLPPHPPPPLRHRNRRRRRTPRRPQGRVPRPPRRLARRPAAPHRPPGSDHRGPAATTALRPRRRPVRRRRTARRGPRLAPLVAARPGLRSPGTADPEELAVRALVGLKRRPSGWCGGTARRWTPRPAASPISSPSRRPWRRSHPANPCPPSPPPWPTAPYGSTRVSTGTTPRPPCSRCPA